MIRRFFSYYRPYTKLFVLDFASAVVAALLELSFPLAVKSIVDNLLPGKDWSLILWACVGLLLMYLGSTGLQFVVTYWGHKLGINIEYDMRRQLFGHIQKLSFRFFDNNKTGHLMSRLTNDLFEIGEMAHHGPEDVFIAVMTLLGAFTMMLFINWKLACLTFLIVPLLIWLVVVCNLKLVKAAKQMFTDIADVNAQVEDSVTGIRVVQTFTNEAHEMDKFTVSNSNYRRAKLHSYRIIAFSSSGMYLLMRLISLFVLLCGAWFVVRGQLSYGEFVGFLLLINIFFKPIEKINAFLESYPKGMAGFKRFLEVLDTEPDVADRPDAIEVRSLRGDIAFQGVTFGYEDHAKVLQSVDLTIRAGETIAFVGPSGAGKTTLCSLLPRFYEIEAGSITIDGMNIRAMTLASLRGHIGIVQQEVFLFSGTLRENIVYGKLGATEAEIWDAARRARLEEFVRSLPLGLDTLVGDRGVKLSGGQKQRLAIARMFLKNPPILILDEATSALDTETEAAIQQSLAELAVGRTTLVIAHRLATIRSADRIVVVTEQGVTEQGRHEELVASGGVYSRLHRAQFGT
ncbi:ABC transporter ATP-binding protein [Paenibacillus cremeus]|uniref:ABC transporter ATP-binding protein n=1 Tax=Paenibacillus cremeus TaxID=2163881 RepID=A0A559KE98_9BACL|nr:ABC transporter ATP-binding protein [Paenibacillus cremeus]TVY10455.1 ABC transporter ATP-binding protein [Paenibacillus cremeus]